ncbi:agmatine deiminase family protein [Algivirga pacifica]|uniref:Agmatine deiminase family protein n=1 Tax=Algivirga pacifica TaxID=1162670 RepID=A0ABP9DKZ5_9BACT
MLRLPAEWEMQDVIQLTLPHEETDWNDMLEEAQACFREIAQQISRHQKLLLVCHNINNVKQWLYGLKGDNVFFAEIPSNDTWARDHGGITIYQDEKPLILDFTFNGWGLKFASALDNEITLKLEKAGFFGNTPVETTGYVLEGGSIESDGQGTIMTTTACLLSYHRNPSLNQQQIEEKLKEWFGASRILWVTEGELEGDDTDAHIDTLARFCSPSRIAYVSCEDPEDPHYSSLKKMEEELKAFRQADGSPYELFPLPMATPQFDPEDGHRLPATYANFLIMNEAILLPTYGDEIRDQQALEIMQKACPAHRIIGINCNALIKQHGSLHCVTMQYPAGSFL